MAACTALGSLGVAVPAASAHIVRLPNGRTISIVRHAPGGGAPGLGAPVGSAAGSGPALSTSAGALAAPSNAHFAPDYESIVDQYLGDVAADSAMTTNVYGVSAQYGAGTSVAGVYQSTFVRQLSDSNAYPANGCTPASGYTSCLSDAQIQSELSKIISAQHLPTDLGAEYFVLLPQGVDECYAKNQCADNAFCAYHANITAAGGPIYAIEPYAGVSGCESGEAPQTGNLSADPGPDSEVSILSHEHNESVTDPLGTSWYDSSGNEIGDKCAYVYGTALGGGSGAEYNQLIAGDRYWLQDEFANVDGTNTSFDNCQQHPGASGDGVATFLQQTRSALGYHGGPVMGAHGTYAIFWDPGSTATPPAGTFTHTPVAAGVPVTFTPDATADPQGGTLSYTWSFGDGTTSNAQSPSHTYGSSSCSPTCTVRLKVSDSAGYWGSSVQRISNLVSSFGSDPSPPVAGSPVSFSPSPSLDPVASYAWSFGDGSGSGSASPTHTYSAPGSYTVALTVTDASGFMSQTTVTLNVLALTAGFDAAPAAPAAGQTVSFTPTASSDPIASYSWDFGDGGSSSGQTPSHAFSQPGTYTVSLTVTDANGISSAVTHALTVAPASFAGGGQPGAQQTAATAVATTSAAGTPSGAAPGATATVASATSAARRALARVLRAGSAWVTRTARGLLLHSGITLACPAGASASCRVAVLLTAVQRSGTGRRARRRTVVLATASLRLAPGSSLTVRIPMTAAGAALLRRSHRLTVRLSVRALGGSAATPLLTRAQTLKAPAAARRKAR